MQQNNTEKILMIEHKDRDQPIISIKNSPDIAHIMYLILNGEISRNNLHSKSHYTLQAFFECYNHITKENFDFILNKLLEILYNIKGSQNDILG